MKRIFTLLVATLAFVACTQNDVEELSANRADLPETLTVGFEGGDDTRIQLNEAQKTVWNEGDLLSVFYFSNANQKWQYQGETGKRIGRLKRVEYREATAETTYNVVVYPYSDSYFLNPRSCALHATLPAVQHYAKDSYGVGDNLMVAQSEFTQFSLKNVCGWLKIQLTGNGERVTRLTLKGNNNEQLAGLIYIDTATAEATLVAEMGSFDDVENSVGGGLVPDDSILTSITLKCSEGVELGAESKAFYIAVLPQTFTNGITVEITDTSDFTMTQTAAQKIIVERNHIVPMAELAFVNPNTPETPDVPIIDSNKIYYTSINNKVVTPNYSNSFGANIVSNIYENGQGIITFDGDVTTIGSYAFYSCDSLTSITIPDSVTTIEPFAFTNCERLTSVNIPDSVSTIAYDAFSHCGSLTSITIPDSVTTIGDSAFSYCSSLTSVTIPDSVTEIGDKVFTYCESLAGFNGKFASKDGRCLIVGGTLNSFAPVGFTEYTIPNSVTTIGMNAFAYCSSLTSITIPDSVTTIRYGAFDDCSSLTSINIPDSVTEIGNSAFSGCNSLTSITIPDSVTDIGIWTFAYCDSLTSVTIGDSVTTIGKYAFYSCDSLTSITIPDSVTMIGNSAFYGCYSLTSVTMGDSIIEIGKNAFNWSSNITSVTIPESTTWIGDSAFYCCKSLESVYCKAVIPPSLGSDVFVANALERTIYVPAASVEAYKSAEGWSEYADAIVGYDFENGKVVE